MSNQAKSMTAIDKVKQIQTILGTVPDGDIGKKTRAAFDHLDQQADTERLVTASLPPNTVKASSFADPKDVTAFRKCKAAGGTDLHCFGKGDNGIGAWGHNTAQTHTPMAALPREVWKAAGKKGGAPLAVTYKGRRVEGILGDTMPSLANIRNGAGIDLNPAFAERLGLKPPFLVSGASWEWL